MAGEEYVFDAIFTLLPFAALLGYFFVENRLAYSAAGLLTSWFVVWFGGTLLGIKALFELGVDGLSYFTLGGIIALLLGAGGRTRGWWGRGAGGLRGQQATQQQQIQQLQAGGAPPGEAIITGTVIEEGSNHPIQGVDVLVEGTTIRIQTDNRGSFRLDVPVGRRTLALFRRPWFRIILTHPHYQNPPPLSTRRLGPNTQTDFGTILMQRRVPPTIHAVQAFLLDHAGNPARTNMVFPGDWVTVAFRVAAGLRLAVPAGLAGGNQDRFVLWDEANNLEIAEVAIPYNAVNYPPGANEVRYRFQVPRNYRNRRRLPFMDIPVRLIPRIQYV